MGRIKSCGTKMTIFSVTILARFKYLNRNGRGNAS